jgi:hypothetical protein
LRRPIDAADQAPGIVSSRRSRRHRCPHGGANLYLKTPIDPLKDLVPVASLVSNDLILAANPSPPGQALGVSVE